MKLYKNDKVELIKNSIEHTLKQSGIASYYTNNAVNLLLGTIAQESNFKYVKQLGNGPAMSYYQIEPETALDVLKNFVEYRQPFKKELKRVTGNKAINKNNVADELLNNFDFSTFIARCCYYRRSAIVLSDTKVLSVEELAKYWKTYYNTNKGKGTVEEFIKNYNLYLTKFTN